MGPRLFAADDDQLNATVSEALRRIRASGRGRRGDPSDPIDDQIEREEETGINAEPKTRLSQRAAR